jgi:predicted dienelactone hydrolase
MIRRMAIPPASTPDVLDLTDPVRPAWRDDAPRPVRTYLWRPAGTPRGTVLLSHGSGGAAETLSWLAEALAAAGFLAVGVDHHGNSYPTGYVAEAFACWWDRPLDLTVALSEVAAHEETGPVGVAGYSAGGYTAAALLGARIDRGIYSDVVHERIPSAPNPEYPNIVEELKSRLTEADLDQWIDHCGRNYRDARARAGFLICPGMAPALDTDSLRHIEEPVSIWSAGADDQTPAPEYALRYASLIPGATHQSAGDSVEHYAFLADNEAGAPARRTVAAAAVDFFTRTLG